MAAKIFTVKDRKTNVVQRLIKAETRGQVTKYLSSSVDIESVGAVDAVELMSSGAFVVEDATTQVADELPSDSAAPHAAEQGGHQE